MDIDYVIKRAKKQIEEQQASLVLMESNYEALADCPFPITYSGDSSRLVIDSIEQLHEARVFMREFYGSWSDSIDNIFYSCGRAIATWRDPKNPWAIWLECSVEDFPKELLPNDTCKFKKITEESYTLQCDLT